MYQSAHSGKQVQFNSTPCTNTRYRAATMIALAAPLVMAAGIVGATVSANTSRCSAAFFTPLAPKNVTIKSADIVAATAAAPQYCRVLASVAVPGNTDDFLAGFPTTWNEHFVWASQGGFAGQTMTLSNGFLQAGYATGITDTGHQGSATATGGAGRDITWALNNPQKLTDYGHRANHVTADAAKSLIASYYQSAITRSIFNGCSNGGRSVMINAQRYPGQFDGYVVGAPFISPTQSSLDYLLHSGRGFFAKTTSFPTAAKLSLVGNAVLAACDVDDGVKDGVVGNPLACRFDPRTLQCPGGGDTAGCLSKDQVDAFVVWNTDVRNVSGELVSRRWLFTGVEGEPTGTTLYQVGPNPAPVDAKGVPIISSAQNLGFSLLNGAIGGFVFQDPSYDVRKFDIETDLGYLAEVDGQIAANDTNLSGVLKNGAKFLFYHGWADPTLNPLNTVDYYNDVVARYGKAKTDSLMRVFMVPGMTHCSGGTATTDTFDTNAAMERWLDTKIAPDVIDASKVVGGVVTRTRPLCAYPTYARYRPPAAAASTFGIEDAFYFSCVAPAQ